MRVLLTENNLSNSLVARSILERENHNVVIATNGAEAIAKFQSTPFDVVLLDIVMPIMDGFQTVRYLNQITDRPTFMFALSAYDTPEDLELYLAAGFDGLIAKPLRRGDLRAAMTTNPGRPATVGFAANNQDASARPLLDEAIIRDGPSKADDVTRQRIWRSYREGLSASLKQMSKALPGSAVRNDAALTEFYKAVHSLRSTSLSVGLDRAPFLAKQLRDIPHDQLVEGVTHLLKAVRESLPVLEAALTAHSRPSVTSGP